MSARATFWAWRVAGPFGLNPTERLVLLCLADGADKATGECWYKIGTLCESTGLSRSGVHRPLRSLEDRHLIRIESVTKEGRSLANTYHLNLDVEKPGGYPKETPVTQKEGAPEMHPGVPEGDTSYPASKTDPALRMDSARDARTASFEDGFEQFWAAFPRKVAKRGALNAWIAAAKSKPRRLPSLDAILQAIHRQGFKLGWFDGSCPVDKIPHPTTWLNQDRWNDELEVRSVSAEKPAPAPADLAALDLRRAIFDAEAEVSKIAPAEDGWTSYSRSIFLDHLDTCKSEAEIADHLARCRAACDRLRASGAFPLRRATSPGEVLPAGGGARILVDLRDGSICDTLCPACGEDQAGGPCSCGDHDADLARRVIAENECCPHGTPYRYPCEECDADTSGIPGYPETPPLSSGMVGAPLEDPGVHPDPRWRGWGNAESSVDRSGIAMIPQKTTADKVQVERIAEGQHAYAHSDLSGRCFWCGQPQDHIRHYLPQGLPFSDKEDS